MIPLLNHWNKLVRCRAAYGSHLFDILFHDVKDRLTGKSHRANARWGFVRPPAEQGRVIWIRAGQSRLSVLMAVNVLCAIREKRLDVRLVLTYEQEYLDILEEPLRDLKKTAYGYGCCDRAGAIRRLLGRLNPCAVIVVADLPGVNWLQCLADYQYIEPQQSRLLPVPMVALQTDFPPEGIAWQVYYPWKQSEYDGLASQVTSVSKPVDMVTLVTPAQVEPTLAKVVMGHNTGKLWWADVDHIDSAHALLNKWQDSRLMDDSILCLSLDESDGQGLAALANYTLSSPSGTSKIIFISQWQRAALTPGSVLILDQWRWLPAVAVSVAATHLMNSCRLKYWQALASGAALTLAPQANSFAERNTALSCPSITDFDQLLAYWCRLHEAPFTGRTVADDNRKIFWSMRRHASQQMSDFLERVFYW